jgi:hypothetical protein
MPRRQRTEADFWARVQQTPTGCWEWQGARDQYGYGNIWVGEHCTKAHRHAYALTNGPIPPGMVICHACDNPPCCNPAHLSVGTTQENSHDARTKGRLHTHPPRGEASPHAKLTTDQVREILALYASGGYRQRDLAARYSVSVAAIAKIVTGRKWKHEYAAYMASRPVHDGEANGLPHAGHGPRN